MKKRIIAGNWKLYIEDEDRAKKLASVLKRKAALFSNVDLMLFPPAPFVSLIAAAVARSFVAVGAQTVAPFEGGAHTGSISARVMKHAGATWALVGHSERRAAGEDNETIFAEVRAAAEAGLSVMLCVGEVERDPSGAHFAGIAAQLTSALKGFEKPGSKLVVAYEPVWAIGKTAAEAMKPAELEEMVIFIRRTLSELFDRKVATKVPILYGGSVDGSNAGALLAEGGVSGFLVGRASTEADSFLEILNICKK